MVLNLDIGVFYVFFLFCLCTVLLLMFSALKNGFLFRIIFDTNYVMYIIGLNISLRTILIVLANQITSIDSYLHDLQYIFHVRIYFIVSDELDAIEEN